MCTFDSFRGNAEVFKLEMLFQTLTDKALHLLKIQFF